MKKNFKKVCSVFLSLVIMFSMTISCFAVDSSAQKAAPVISDESVRDLSGNDAISALMQRCDLSYSEAAQKYGEMVARNITLQERHVTVPAGAGYQVEVGCLVNVHCGGGHCNFGEIEKTWSLATGSGNYTWTEAYSHATVIGQYAEGLHFQARGVIEVAVSTSTSSGLEAAGFSVSGTIGNTTYYRKTMDIDRQWYPGSHN